MAFLCKIFGHRWNGCRCTRCGAQRDTDHAFERAEGKCLNVCTLCGKEEEAEHLWHHCSCTHCGQTRDEDHDWFATSECEEVCHLCGKERSSHAYVPHERGVDKCRYCGKVHHLSPEEIAQRDAEWEENGMGC